MNGLTGENFVPTENEKYLPSELSIPITTKHIFILPVEEPYERTHIIALIDEELKARLIYNFYGNYSHPITIIIISNNYSFTYTQIMKMP